MAKHKRIVIGNWKMYIDSPAVAMDVVRHVNRKTAGSKIEIGFAVPFVLLPTMANALKNSKIMLGAQKLSAHGGGAHTGEISAGMLKAVGASFVIVGHSERRENETDAMIAEELLRASEAKLRVVLCVGEKNRDESGAHFEFIAAQLKSALAAFPKISAARSLIIAYEPIWAIGKQADAAMKPAELREMEIFIRKKLTEILGRENAMKVPVLYGGSVEEGNAQSLIEGGDVAGFLVGHASASAATFLPIIQVCEK
jgi:triosephosphate isomerase (TIM)